MCRLTCNSLDRNLKLKKRRGTHSSILSRAVQASKALFSILILLIIGSMTPSLTLSTTLPSYKFNPKYLSCFLGSPFGQVWDRLWNARSLATRSVESLAALVASVLGITSIDAANSAIASCSREPCIPPKIRSLRKIRLKSTHLWRKDKTNQCGCKVFEVNA